jgi:choline dehydrogenase-like flavoprotein
MNIGLPTAGTDFSLDVLGRYICNTFDEALANSDAAYRATATDVKGNPLPPRPDMRPFDLIIIGGGTFGAALAEHLWFRSRNRSERILVLEAGPFFLAEHQQNLPSLSLGNEVWGRSWNASPNLQFPGLSYCVGGRSVWWGGWSPRLLDAETPAAVWPAAVLADLNAPTLPNGDNGYFRQASQQIGVTTTNDFIFGALHTALRRQLFDAIRAGRITDAMDLTTLPEAPPVEILTLPAAQADRLVTLASLLGVPLPNPLPVGQPALDALEQDMRDQLKLEAPLAVQAQPEHAGFFPINKFSTVPLLIKAARGAQRDANGDDVRKRVMVVPRCHVTRLTVVNDPIVPGGRRVDGVLTERGRVPVSPDANVIIALGTIESARLALLSFGEDGRIGTNLIAHLRSNVGLRVPRAALGALLPAAVRALQTSALFLKGRHTFADGTFGHFHFQITASGLGNTDTNSEAELFQKVPDIEFVNQHLQATDSHVVITIRGIGEMEPGNPNSNVTRDLDPGQTDYGERKAFVNLVPSAKDTQLWDALDAASDELATVFSNGQIVDIIHPITNAVVAQGVNVATITAALPRVIRDQNNPAGRRDPLGTTHHEAGTLRMGDNANASVTDANCRFHGITNAYVVGPAVFPTVGSPNPMLTGIALARRLGDHLLPPPPAAPADAGFTYLFDGTQPAAAVFRDWLMAGQGRFTLVGRSLVAQPGNSIGLLFYAARQFNDFTLRLHFCLPHPHGPGNDNSGVFVRFRDPRLPVRAGTPGPDIPGNQATVAVDTGYEIQIDEEARGDTRKGEADGHLFNRTGAIYKVPLGAALGQQQYTNAQRLAPGVWHSLEVTAVGRSYTVLLDGQASTAFQVDPADPNEQFRGRTSAEDPASGFIGLQVHTGNVAFANVRIR